MEKQTQTNIKEQNWINAEQDTLGTANNYEKLPGLKMVENKITELTIDISKKFETYTGQNQDNLPVVKAIVPVTVQGERLNWWLNKKNPTYHQLLTLAAKCFPSPTMTIKVIRTGQAKATKYAIVE